jgi:hypothetical protein
MDPKGSPCYTLHRWLILLLSRRCPAEIRELTTTPTPSRKVTLREWRREFARHLRDQGIAANATERAVRGDGTRPPHPIYRATCAAIQSAPGLEPKPSPPNF